MMTTKTKAIQDYLDEILPNVGCELNYTKPHELLIAVVLSAQTTDKSVNAVTPLLFSKYPTVEALANADVKDVEEVIRAIGLYKNKAKNIVLLSQELVNRFNGNVPREKSDLVSLPGVGNKTASVVRLELFHEEEFPVDTHVDRISKRLSLAKKDDDVLEVERKLKKAFPRSSWGKLHHQFIHFGRTKCFARSPNCENCKIMAFCKEKH